MSSDALHYSSNAPSDAPRKQHSILLNDCEEPSDRAGGGGQPQDGGHGRGQRGYGGQVQVTGLHVREIVLEHNT